MSGGIGLFTPSQPWSAQILPLIAPAATTGFTTQFVSSSLYYCGAKYNGSGAQNDFAAWDVLLSAGTWTLEVMHARSTDRGIATISLSPDRTTFTNISDMGASAGTIDGYNGSAANNTVTTITGIVVPSSGSWRIKFLIATKHASSSGYIFAFQHIGLQRTA